MLEQGNRTFIGSVCFVDIVGYSKQSVSEQITLKDRFTALLSESLKDVAPDQRIILDTGDGAALSFLGDPEDALFVSMNMRDFLSRAAADRVAAESANALGGEVTLVNELSLRIGVNLGPVKLIRDINGQPNIVGDGINVAQRIMSFANPGQIVVSRSYFDVVSVISDEYAKLFKYEGSRTDKHVREHEIYVVGESAAAFDKAKAGMVDRAASTNTKIKAGGATTGGRGFKWGGGSGAASAGNALAAIIHDPKKLVLAGGALAVIVLALLFALLIKKPSDNSTDPLKVAVARTESPPPGVPMATAAATPPGSGSEVAPPGDTRPREIAVTTPVAPPPAPAADEKRAAKAEPAKAPPPGMVNFSIQPWGEVFINGKSIGASPPMKQARLAPGKYKIEIRNTSFPPFVANLDVKAKEEVGVKHKFQ